MPHTGLFSFRGQASRHLYMRQTTRQSESTAMPPLAKINCWLMQNKPHSTTQGVACPALHYHKHWRGPGRARTAPQLKEWRAGKGGGCTDCGGGEADSVLTCPVQRCRCAQCPCHPRKVPHMPLWSCPCKLLRSRYRRSCRSCRRLAQRQLGTRCNLQNSKGMYGCWR